MSKRTRQLLRENNEREQALTSEGNRVLTDIVVYLRGANISTYQQEIVRRDITEMILEGERRGNSIEEVIGGDSQAFCDEVLSEIPKLSKRDRALSAFGNGCLYLAVLGAIWLGFHLFGVILGEGSLRLLPIQMGDVVGAVVILCAAVGLFFLVSRNAFQEQRLLGGKLFFLLFVILLAGVASKAFLKPVLFTVHAYVIIAGILVLLAVYKIVDAKEE